MTGALRLVCGSSRCLASLCNQPAGNHLSGQDVSETSAPGLADMISLGMTRQSWILPLQRLFQPRMISVSEYAGCLTRRGLLSRVACKLTPRAEKPALHDYLAANDALISIAQQPSRCCPIPTYYSKRPHKHLPWLTLHNCRTLLVYIVAHGSQPCTH